MCKWAAYTSLLHKGGVGHGIDESQKEPQIPDWVRICLVVSIERAGHKSVGGRW